MSKQSGGSGEASPSSPATPRIEIREPSINELSAASDDCIFLPAITLRPNGDSDDGHGGDERRRGSILKPAHLEERHRNASSVTFDTDAESLDTSSHRRSKSLPRKASLSPSLFGERNLDPRLSISQIKESMDFYPFVNQSPETPEAIRRNSILRWLVNFLLAAYVVVIAIVVAVLIGTFSSLKFALLYSLLEDCDSVLCLLPGALVWITVNVLLIFVGSYIVTYHAPTAAGSGIPQIKCYLNGIHIPGLLSVRTLFAKAGGVVLSVVGGLACGKEGPMIHSGSICASGLASGDYGLSDRCRWKPEFMAHMRTDEERRDFVAAGAASGVSAAFASPVGGVLFSMEEGASFLNQTLTWRMLFSSACASLLLNIAMSALKGHPSDMSEPGLVSFGHIGDISFKTYEIPIFACMAVIGGLSGALFIHLNFKVTLFRSRYQARWMRVVEACLVAGCSAVILLAVIYVAPDCHPIEGLAASSPNSTNQSAPPTAADRHVVTYATDLANHTTDVLDHDVLDHDGHHDAHSPYGKHGNHGYIMKAFCPEGEYSPMGKLLFATPEGGLHGMLHEDKETYTYGPLVFLLVVYHPLAVWTYGLSVSSGVFIPSLFIGSIWGRLIGMLVLHHLPSAGPNIGKYALIGAACQLGGTVRMTISLTVIIVECTGDITFGIPIMISLMIAKWTGDFFNTGIYDLHIEIMGLPLLGWEPAQSCHDKSARDLMSADVRVFSAVEKLGRIQSVLDEESHNGFPVVDQYDPSGGTPGRLRGLILRPQLVSVLYGDDKETQNDLDPNEDLSLVQHMDRSPFTVNEHTSYERIFKFFRGLGLRHLVVVDSSNRVVGMITRVDVAKYREETHKGRTKLLVIERRS